MKRLPITWKVCMVLFIHGMVCDGIRGLFLELRQYRVQMCQFHQMMIVRRYLTRNLELPAIVELFEISNRITPIDKDSFIGMLNAWYSKWERFLKERSTDMRTRRISYAYKRVRSAYLSLKRNMPWLWTFQDYSKLHVPNTNNAIEGVFTDIKTKLRVLQAAYLK